MSDLAARDEPKDKKPKLVTIYVNTRPYEVEKDEISYEEVVALAYPAAPPGGNLSYSVMYERAHGGQDGTLVAGESVKVKDRMRFDVTPTDRS